MSGNDKIVSQLKKMGPIDVSDGVSRVSLIAELSRGGKDRRVVAGALDAWSRTSKDGIVNTDKDRRALAALITRETNRAPASRPMARGLRSSMDAMRRSKWNFNPSKGKGVRTFDKRWRGYLMADVKTKRNAEGLAKELRKYNRGKVRVVPYQDRKKTHYSVYVEKPAPIINKKHMKSIRRHGSEADKTAYKRMNPYVVKKNLFKRGIKKRR